MKRLRFEKYFFDPVALNKFCAQDVLRLKVVEKHYCICNKSSNRRYTLTSLKNSEDIVLFNNKLTIVPYFISARNFKNQNRSQYISSPGFDVESIMDYTALEIDIVDNQRVYDMGSAYLEANLVKVSELIEQIDRSESVLVIGGKAIELKKIYGFKKQ